MRLRHWEVRSENKFYRGERGKEKEEWRVREREIHCNGVVLSWLGSKNRPWQVYMTEVVKVNRGNNRIQISISLVIGAIITIIDLCPNMILPRYASTIAAMPFMAFRKILGSAERQGWCVGSMTFSATMAY